MCKDPVAIGRRVILKRRKDGVVGVQTAKEDNIKNQERYMEFRKMVTITLYAKQKKRHRCTEQTFGLCGRRRGWDVQREQH